MKSKYVLSLAISGLMITGMTGCKKASKDSSQVLASVGGDKISAAKFQELAKLVLNDDKKTDDFLKSDAAKEERNQFLESLAMQKAMIRFAKAEQLDKDAKANFMLDQAQASVYFQRLVEKRVNKQEPTEADLKALYEKLVADRKAAGQDKDLPTFDKVKDRLPAIWKQEQEQTAKKGVLKEVRAKFPVTFAEGYKPSAQAGE